MNDYDNDLLSVTAFFSALFHAALILGVSFTLPKFANLQEVDNTLDVVIINRPNDEEPEQADTVSDANNLGGGEQDREAESPLPHKLVNKAPVESRKQTQAPSPQQVKPAAAMLTSIGDDFFEAKPEEQKRPTPLNPNGQDLVDTKTEKQLERERLIAKLANDWANYQKRPRRTFLSPTSKQHDAARYLNEWRERVEAIGNANYPERMRRQNLSGSVTVDVAINPNGTVNAVKVLSPSKLKVVNDAAVRFVRDAAPYPSFPESLRKNTDILHVTRAFHFGSAGLSSSDASSFQRR